MDWNRIDFLSRLKRWRDNTAAAVAAIGEQNATLQARVQELENSLNTRHAASLAAIEQQLVTLASRISMLAESHDRLLLELADVFRVRAQLCGPAGVVLAGARDAFITERDGEVVIVSVLGESDDAVLRSGDVLGLVGRIADGSVTRLFVTADPPARGEATLQPADELIPLFREMPILAAAFFLRTRPAPPHLDATEFYRSALSRLRVNPYLVDAASAHFARCFGAAPAPFHETGALPATLPAEPKRRSALLLHNSYYHFNCLGSALRKRGWDVLTVSLESPDSPQRQFYHGEDLNLFDPDQQAMRKKVGGFFASVPERFGALHFSGEGYSSFFHENCESQARPTRLPWDFFELRRSRMIIGYMPSGCLDGARQSDIRRISGGVCAQCVWEDQPTVCNDARSAAWAERLDAVCDWVGLEGDWVVGPRTGAKFVRGPVVTALDPELWRPDLEVPEDMRLTRTRPDEVLVFHAVGNYETRRRGDRDIKGTGAVMRAVETLRVEGVPVRLAFFSKTPSTMMRFYQAQADIVVDQLNYGRYGANARECMMLGRPVIGAIDSVQEDTDRPSRHLAECPIIVGNTATIVDVLRAVATDPERRERAGRESRAFALRWHASEVCAERYERVVDRIRGGHTPDSPDLYPPPEAVSPWPGARRALKQG